MRHRGFSLLELALVLALVGMLLAGAAPALLHARDLAAVRAARAELAGALARTRSAAVLGGGAQLVIDPGGELALQRPDGTAMGEVVPLHARYTVTLQTPRAVPLVVRYDGVGIGRMASATIQLRRGRAVATLTISAYGRVRT